MKKLPALVLRKVFISGHWTWEAQVAGGSVSIAKPYACKAGKNQPRVDSAPTSRHIHAVYVCNYI